MTPKPAFAAAALALLMVGCNSSGGSTLAPPDAPQSPASSPTAEPRFGKDADANGVPDRLDSYVATLQGGASTKAAATGYFRVLSRLSGKALDGIALSNDEGQLVFSSFACYYLSAKAEGLEPVSLDAEWSRDRNAFNGLHALMGAMNGTLADTSTVRDEACADASR